jgi:hypothetical protein
MYIAARTATLQPSRCRLVVTLRAATAVLLAPHGMC